MIAKEQTADSPSRAAVDCVVTIRFNAPDEKAAKRLGYLLSVESAARNLMDYENVAYDSRTGSRDGIATLEIDAEYQPQPQKVCREGE